jgi:hypothetical protein
MYVQHIPMEQILQCHNKKIVDTDKLYIGTNQQIVR